MDTNLLILLILIALIGGGWSIRVQTSYGVWNMVNTSRGLIAKHNSFMIDEQKQQFLLDGKPFRYISGSIHYFRLPKSQWQDRLKKVRALGFNAIQYYIPWNMHEFEENQFSFEDLLDFGDFSQIAHDNGLWTILRIGPYICAEWENGGLPAWLLTKGIKKMRTSDPIYLSYVEKWFNVLLPRIKPMLRKNGGPVLMLQIENEYGSFECDKKYLTFLRDLTIKHLGDDVLLFTTDGSDEQLVKCGSIDGVLATVDFGPTTDPTVIANNFKVQRKFAPNAPLVNSEYYPGWFVLWGQKTQNLPSVQTTIQGMQGMYDMGASFNFYMIHGGTNFGFWNGAEKDAPVITSYDYGAPISEAGDITPAYLEIRKWLKSLKGWKTRPKDVPKDVPKRSYGTSVLYKVHSITTMAQENADDCAYSEHPQSFEELDHPYGLIAYQTNISACGNLSIPTFGDFAYVYVNSKYMGTLFRYYYGESRHSMIIDNCNDSEMNKLFILVENQGRITYLTANDHKGILSDVRIDNKAINGWTQCGVKLPLADLLDEQAEDNQNQGVFMGIIDIDEPADTWIDTSGWGKGMVIINGNNLGRYWSTVGPQFGLYCPAEFLKVGQNSVMFVELQGADAACTNGVGCNASFMDHPLFKFKKTIMF